MGNLVEHFAHFPAPVPYIPAAHGAYNAIIATVSEHSHWIALFDSTSLSRDLIVLMVLKIWLMNIHSTEGGGKVEFLKYG